MIRVLLACLLWIAPMSAAIAAPTTLPATRPSTVVGVAAPVVKKHLAATTSGWRKIAAARDAL